MGSLCSKNRDLTQELSSTELAPVVNLTKEKLVAKGARRLEDTYEIRKKLGQGSFGAVYLGVNKQTGELRAIKKLKKPKDYDRYRVSAEVHNEIDILTSLDHQNIMKVYEYYENDLEISIVSECCEGGELFAKVMKEGPLDEITSCIVMFQLLGAISYCHSMNVMHRDLKTENVLIESKKHCGYIRIKLIDFGLSMILDKGKFESDLAGTAAYVAPEVIDKNYDKRCDLWSCGVILYVILTGKLPFGGGENQKNTFANIKKGIYNTDLEEMKKASDEAKDLLSKLLVVNPASRISAEDALMHPWFEKFKIKDKLSELSKEKICELINNVKKYKPDNILQISALAYIVHNLPNIEEVKDACKLFIKIDTNLDGTLSKEEFVRGMNELVEDNEKFNVDELNEIFDIIDSDKSGTIEYEEFIRAAADKSALLKDNYIKDAFNFYDKDKSGKITLDEINQVLFQGKNKDIKELKSIAKLADKNKDNKIDFNEFKQNLIKINN